MPSALAIGTASRGYLKMLHLHWLLTHPRLHLPRRLRAAIRAVLIRVRPVYAPGGIFSGCKLAKHKLRLVAEHL